MVVVLAWSIQKALNAVSSQSYHQMHEQVHWYCLPSDAPSDATCGALAQKSPALGICVGSRCWPGPCPAQRPCWPEWHLPPAPSGQLATSHSSEHPGWALLSCSCQPLRHLVVGLQGWLFLQASDLKSDTHLPVSETHSMQLDEPSLTKPYLLRASNIKVSKQLSHSLCSSAAPVAARPGSC